ncbi:hypothetical protein DFH06DRAFT_1178752 [Mycena polygramma]|nr:hypothetical protein DFH06DRAFT_1178752 [Mycena polygramma]
MYYMAAGERGTIEARGLERQRKFDGLRKWRFDTVMQMFPLLLQIGLFLFSAALSIYLWRIHLSLALIVFSFTSIGSISYIALLITAVTSPDSPFQTPLAPLVVRLLPRTLWMRWKWFFATVAAELGALLQDAYAAVEHLPQVHNFLPFFNIDATTHEMVRQSSLAPLFEGFLPTSSQEVPAVSWVLDMSTDPHTITAAAAMVKDLQWPGDIDVKPHLSKLRDGILSCFYHAIFPNRPEKIGLYGAWDGMSIDAMHLGRAYCTLWCILMAGDPNPQTTREYWCFSSFPHVGSNDDKQLETVMELLAGSSGFSCISQDAEATKWALNVISSQWHNERETPHYLNYIPVDFIMPPLDTATFADYLFALDTFLSDSPNKCGLVWMDKSPFLEDLLEHLFDALASHIQSRQMSMDTAANMINSLRQITCSGLPSNSWPFKFAPLCPRFVYQFCNSLPRWEGWIGVVLATGFLTARLNHVSRLIHSPRDAGWVYEALECIDVAEKGDWDDITQRGIAGLLAALRYYGVPVEKKQIPILLQALKVRSDAMVAENAAFLLVLDNQFVWFQDEELQPILHGASAWSSLINVGYIDNLNYYTKCCIHMGSKLIQMSYWKPHVLAELPSWITMFFRARRADSLAKMYNTVLEEACQTGHDSTYNFGNQGERALGLHQTFDTLPCDLVQGRKRPKKVKKGRKATRSPGYV